MDKDFRTEWLKLNKPFLTAKDVADLLNLSVNHIYRLARLKQIPSQKIGRSRRFRAVDTLMWLEQKGGKL